MRYIPYLAVCLMIAFTAIVTVEQYTPRPEYADLMIEMVRDSCYGHCPIYKLTIYGDGKVEYEGQDYVQVKGHRRIWIGQDRIKELVNAIEASGFYSFEELYGFLHDLPRARLNVTINGEAKGSSHSLNCSEMSSSDSKVPPVALCELEDKIDAIVNPEQWVGKGKTVGD